MQAHAFMTEKIIVINPLYHELHIFSINVSKLRYKKRPQKNPTVR
jgi:hypothetical protein